MNLRFKIFKKAFNGRNNRMLVYEFGFASQKKLIETSDLVTF